jgi:hypothetical protein
VVLQVAATAAHPSRVTAAHHRVASTVLLRRASTVLRRASSSTVSRPREVSTVSRLSRDTDSSLVATHLRASSTVSSSVLPRAVQEATPASSSMARLPRATLAVPAVKLV